MEFIIYAASEASTHGPEPGGDARRVGNLEHQADHARRDLVHALREALTTSVDQEHLVGALRPHRQRHESPCASGPSARLAP